MGLSAKRAAFVREYVIDNNGTQAAIRAGYSRRTAAAQAVKLLRLRDVKAAIAEARQQLAQQAGVDAERVVAELAAVALADPIDLFDGESLRPLRDVPEAARRAIAAVKIRTVKTRGKAKPAATITELRFWPKVAALEKLGRHLGLFREQLDVNVNGQVEVVETIVTDRKQAKAVLAALSKAGAVPRQ